MSRQIYAVCPKCLFSLLLLLSIGLPALGQASSSSAAVSGIVQDTTDARIPNASVKLINTDTGTESNSTTSKDGNFTIPSVLPGHYRLQIEREGFDTTQLTGITLNVGDNKNVIIRMKVGSPQQTVTVDGSGLTINTTDASVSTVIDRDFVQNMPLNGRSFQDLLTLSPGVSQVPVNPLGGTAGGVGYSGEIVVNGQRTEGNYYTVDGVSANTSIVPGYLGGGGGSSGGVPAETALGTTQSLVSIDALQEFRATTSTYSAEYGRTPGGQFSFTTRSGTRDWHGTLYDYLRNDALDANNWFNNYLHQPKGEERQNDFGGTLGGPIDIPKLYNGKDKTFFFFSYEGLRVDSPQAATQVSVPDATLRQHAPAALQPLLNAFPAPNGGEDGLNDGLAFYIQTVSYPAQLDSIAIRVDHTFSDKFKVFGRYTYSPSSTKSYNAAVATDTSLALHGVTIGSTNTVRSNQVNDARFNFTQNGGTYAETSTDLGGAAPFNLSTIPGPEGNAFPANQGKLNVQLLFGGEPGFILQNSRSVQQQYNFTDSYNWTIGKHSLKFGVDWRQLATTLVPVSLIEDLYFLSESEVLSNNADLGIVNSDGLFTYKPVYLNISSFVEDEWKTNRRLSVSLGLRWDINPAPSTAEGPNPYTLNQINDLATAQLAPAGTPLWKTDWRGFAPRIGIAYQLHQSPGHQTVLRTGFGVFYDLGNLQGSSGYGQVGTSSSQEYFGLSFPMTSAQLQLPPASIAPPYDNTVAAFDPNLKLPYSLQYNVAIEQALGVSQSLTVNYVGSVGRRLLTTFELLPATFGNPNFTSSGLLELTQGLASSNYNSLQIKYQRTLSKGLQALTSYTWSHAIDNASNNFGIAELLRSNSDYDIRHNFQAAVTYEIPRGRLEHIAGAVLSQWNIDARVQARSSLPINLIGATSIAPDSGEEESFQPDFVPGNPTYIRGSQYPGHRIINYMAFTSAPAGVEGNVPRNYTRAFDALQLDTAIHRQFPIYEKLHLQFRAEAFNITNHPNFGNIYNQLSYGPAQFGYAYTTLNQQLGGLNPLYQVGGPRSLQMSLRLIF